MLLSKWKIETLHEAFKTPYKPILSSYVSTQKEDLSRIATEIKNSRTFTSKSQYNSNTYNERKSSFPIYATKTVAKNEPTPEIITYNYDYVYYGPLSSEILINNPEEVIQSGALKGSIIPGQESIKKTLPPIYENINNQNLDNFNIGTAGQGINIPNGEIAPEQLQNNNIDNIIPGNVYETKLIDKNTTSNEIPEVTPAIEENAPAEEEPIKETVALKKYVIDNPNGRIVSFPGDYSTDDFEEYTAINTLNQDLGSPWKLYTERDSIKLYFKPYPVKDEKGKDAESVIGYCEATLDFPASKVIEKINDYEFRKNIDGQYRRGKLINERMEGNIKYMDMYLYMKMPFIFSDRDFVVQKKCWLDYNGNKDHALFYLHSVDNPNFPPVSKLVRGTFENRSGYVKPLGSNKCQIVTVSAMDVKMSLGYDTMAKNGAEMQEEWIKGLRKHLAKC